MYDAEAPVRRSRGAETVQLAAPGHIEVICGSMFSGKSDELIRRVRRWIIAKRRVLVAKPVVDTRYNVQEVSSHNGERLAAEMVHPDRPGRIADDAQGLDAHVVAIDEAQFFSTELVDVVDGLIREGRRLILAGLDMDFARRPFGPMPTLLAMADEVTKLKAICTVCGEPATYSQRLIDGTPAGRSAPVIVIGGREAYEARCRRCHELPD